MKVIVCKDYDEMSEEAAQIFIKQIQEKHDSVLGLATGSSPIGMYKELIKANNDGAIDFKDVITFNLDEYVGLNKDHPASYYYFMNENLFNHINIDKKNTHIPHAEGADLEKAAEDYEESLSHYEIDLQVLGVGKNGHIGFNEPGDDLSSVTYVQELSESTRVANSRFFDDIDDVPKFAITMGVGSIFKAKKIVLIASGNQKSFAIDYLLNSKKISSKVPVSLLNLHPDVTVIIDEKLASLVIK